jgi:DNA (cytosine-5)-methyltransferase 1
MEKTRIKVGSDFSGIGAFNEALKRNSISFEEKFACNYDEYARKTFIILNGTEADLELVNSKEHSKHCKNVKNIIFYDYSKIKNDLELEKLKQDHAETLNLANEFAKQFSFYYPFNVYDREIPEESIDIYMTSPPCQAFSLAGKRLGKDDIRGILFF